MIRAASSLAPGSSMHYVSTGLGVAHSAARYCISHCTRVAQTAVLKRQVENSAVERGGAAGKRASGSGGINEKEAQCPYVSYQECGFLHLIWQGSREIGSDTFEEWRQREFWRAGGAVAFHETQLGKRCVSTGHRTATAWTDCAAVPRRFPWQNLVRSWGYRTLCQYRASCRTSVGRQVTCNTASSETWLQLQRCQCQASRRQIAESTCFSVALTWKSTRDTCAIRISGMPYAV